MNISEINNLNTIKSTSQLSKGSKNKNESSFKDMLEDALKSVNDLQNDYEEMIGRKIIGDKDIDVHDITIAGEKARLSLELTLQVRNKAIEAYQEIMRMQV